MLKTTWGTFCPFHLPKDLLPYAQKGDGDELVLNVKLVFAYDLFLEHKPCGSSCVLCNWLVGFWLGDALAA